MFKKTNIKPAYTVCYTIQNGIMVKQKSRHVQTQQNIQTAKQCKKRQKMISEVLTAVLMKFQVFWDVKLC